MRSRNRWAGCGSGGCLQVRIDSAPCDGANLGPDKGINLPQTRLDLPRPTPEDVADLEFAVAWADMVGFSFVEQPADVLRLEELLVERGGPAARRGGVAPATPVCGI